jgi:hypothetical protein
MKTQAARRQNDSNPFRAHLGTQIASSKSRNNASKSFIYRAVNVIARDRRRTINNFMEAHVAIGNIIHFRLLSASVIDFHIASEEVGYSQDYGELT